MSNIRVLSLCFAAIICLFCAISLTACNSGLKKPAQEDREYFLYIGGYIYDDGNETVTAIVKMSTAQKDGATNIDAKATWRILNYADDIWYNKQNVKISLQSNAVFGEAKALAGDEVFEKDGKTYNVLKVALRYDTIYKHIKSDGEIVKSGRYYLHTFDIDEEEHTQTFELNFKSQNSASWYSVLISCCIALAVALIGATAAIKGGVWQKKKKE